MLINIDLLVVCCCLWTAQICDGLVQLTAISRTDLSQHTSLSGDITLPWTCEALQGTVQVQQCAVVYLNTVSLCVASREKQLLLFLCSQICSKINLSVTPFYLQAKENTVQISICIIMFCSFDLCSWIVFFKTLAHLYIYIYLYIHWHWRLFLTPRFFLELLHHESHFTGRIQETLLVCQLSPVHDAGEDARLLRLWRRALPDPLWGLRWSGEDGTRMDEGKKAVFPCKLGCLCACLQSQQAFQSRLLKPLYFCFVIITVACYDFAFYYFN